MVLFFLIIGCHDGIREALPGVWGGFLFPCFSEINCFVPQTKNLDFLCSLFPKPVFVPLIFRHLFPWNRCPCSLVPQNLWEGLNWDIQNILPRTEVVRDIAGNMSLMTVKNTAIVNRMVNVYDSFSPHSTGTTKTRVTRKDDRIMGNMTLVL